MLSDAGRKGEALDQFRRALALQPGNIHIEHQIRRLSAELVPFWHIPMLNDVRRNDAFEAAISAALAEAGPDARVLDIGTGSGLLSMMAARAGARSVTACEVVPVIADMATKIIADNGYSDPNHRAQPAVDRAARRRSARRARRHIGLRNIVQRPADRACHRHVRGCARAAAQEGRHRHPARRSGHRLPGRKPGAGRLCVRRSGLGLRPVALRRAGIAQAADPRHDDRLAAAVRRCRTGPYRPHPHPA